MTSVQMGPFFGAVGTATSLYRHLRLVRHLQHPVRARQEHRNLARVPLPGRLLRFRAVNRAYTLRAPSEVFAPLSVFLSEPHARVEFGRRDRRHVLRVRTGGRNEPLLRCSDARACHRGKSPHSLMINVTRLSLPALPGRESRRIQNIRLEKSSLIFMNSCC